MRRPASYGAPGFGRASAIVLLEVAWVLLGIGAPVHAQDEPLRTLQQYVRIDTSNPPGDVTKAADFLAAILEREGVPVRRYQFAPGCTILLARLEGTGPAKPLLLLHHMDVAPADASAIVTPMIVPFGTDSNGFRPRGVKSYGFFPAILPAAALLSMHGDAEFVPVDALGSAIQMLFEALKETVARPILHGSAPVQPTTATGARGPCS